MPSLDSCMRPIRLIIISRRINFSTSESYAGSLKILCKDFETRIHLHILSVIVSCWDTLFSPSIKCVSLQKSEIGHVSVGQIWKMHIPIHWWFNAAECILWRRGINECMHNIHYTKPQSNTEDKCPIDIYSLQWFGNEFVWNTNSTKSLLPRKFQSLSLES